MKTYRIDDAKSLVLVEYSGVVTDSDLQVGLDDYVSMGAQYAFLIDLTGVQEFQVTTEGLRKLAAYAGPALRKRCAIIAPSDVAYGLSRMMETFAQNPGAAVFRTAGEARDWLDAPAS